MVAAQSEAKALDVPHATEPPTPAEPSLAAAYSGFAVFFLFAISIAALEILDRSNPIRWLAYFVPPLGLGAALLTGNLRIATPLVVTSWFAVVFTLSCLANWDSLDWFYAGRDFVIYTLILATLFIRLPLTSEQIFFSMCCTFFLVFSFLIAHTTLQVSLRYDPGVIRGESTASIVYGALTLFFLINRRFTFALAALVFAVFTFKRTSYVYFLGAAGFWAMSEACIWMVGPKYRRTLIAIFIVVLFLGCLVFSFYLLDALSLAQRTFSPEQQLREFTTGRSELYRLILHTYESVSPLHILFGYGPGSIEKLGLESVGIDLAHNEFFHHLFDYGAFGILFLFIFLATLLAMAPRNYSIIAYVIMVSLTDNPVYVFIVAIPIICLFSMEIDEFRQPRGSTYRTPVRTCSSPAFRRT